MNKYEEEKEQMFKRNKKLPIFSEQIYKLAS